MRAKVATVDEGAARAWCEGVARACAVQRIAPAGVPYLDRYFAAGWRPGAQPGPAIFLHHFVASDPAVQVHSHPWDWSASLILAGGYREERCVGKRVESRQVREYRPGDVNVLTADDRHRVDLFGSDCWTLFLAGRFEKPWAFAPSCG